MDPEIYLLDDYPAVVKHEAMRLTTQIRSSPNHAKIVAETLVNAGLKPTGNAAGDALDAAMAWHRTNFSLSLFLESNAELLGIGVLTGFGIAGIFDPTPFSDGTATVIALAMMRYGWGYGIDAGLSAVSVVPYLGDTVGKPVLAARLTARSAKLMAVVERFKGTQQLVRVFAKAATTGSKGLDDILRVASSMDDVPYESMGTLTKYMKKRGVEVICGQKGAETLDQLGHMEALGMFCVFKHPRDPTQTVSGLVFRGEPSRAIVHHELWHRNDFLRNYKGSYDLFKEGKSIAKERYVHQRMMGTGEAVEGLTAAQKARAGRRWGDYLPKEKLNQVVYVEKLERVSQIADVLDELAKLGIKLE